MDPPIINESSFSAANPSAYSLAGIWPFIGGDGPGNGVVVGGGGGLGLRMGSMGWFLDAAAVAGGGREGASGDVSSVTENSGNGVKRKTDNGLGGKGNGNCEDECSKMVSTSSGNDLTTSNGNGKRMRLGLSRDENGRAKVEGETSSASGSKQGEENKKPSELPKQDYIHVRARRGQATDSHSLAERARREKISERMKILQDLVPGCNKVIGKALVLDEIINYIQSLQRQVEFLSMKLEAVNSRMNMHPGLDGFPAKDLGAHPFDAAGMMFASQAEREFAVHGTHPEWLHMQLGSGNF
ncbi:hypothetical protein MLD38_026159 [Melastoma candidum]|uniref:Uncharacterized protein n=1 Tax=Melastoma candidum TaxID=119954 RepID=A0ACB9NZ26_9MYRT|nr:hypothetical protein MLD38_026159 [Melastoma candidum]